MSSAPNHVAAEGETPSTACWRCHRTFLPDVQAITDTDAHKERVKCACCRREYERRHFGGKDRGRSFVAPRCVVCVSAGPQVHAEIVKEDEYKDQWTAYLERKEGQQRREGGKRALMQSKQAKSAAERAKSRARRNFRRDLDKQVEREFDRKRRKIQEELLPKQVAARIAAEMEADKLEREYRAQMEARSTSSTTNGT